MVNEELYRDLWVALCKKEGHIKPEPNRRLPNMNTCAGKIMQVIGQSALTAEQLGRKIGMRTETARRAANRLCWAGKMTKNTDGKFVTYAAVK